jgi:predicted anti-sigma-YlaC factor YlaD
MRHAYATINLTCRRAARLLSDEMERPLTRLERFGLTAHLLGCRSCRRYRDQQSLLAATLRSNDEALVESARLSPGARVRLAVLLDLVVQAQRAEDGEPEPLP